MWGRPFVCARRAFRLYTGLDEGRRWSTRGRETSWWMWNRAQTPSIDPLFLSSYTIWCQNEGGAGGPREPQKKQVWRKQHLVSVKTPQHCSSVMWIPSTAFTVTVTGGTSLRAKNSRNQDELTLQHPKWKCCLANISHEHDTKMHNTKQNRPRSTLNSAAQGHSKNMVIFLFFPYLTVERLSNQPVF